MNLLARAKLSVNLIFPAPFQPKTHFNFRPFFALRPFTNSYSTKPISPKKLQLTNPKTHKPSETTPSSTFSKRIKKQTEALIWPKPREIPYQEKVANFVNLIGYVKAPVHFEALSDGTHFAATVVSSGEKSSLSIPVVFDGDLAHIVSCHVKENDCVFVSGQLSVDSSRVVSTDVSLGKLHVVAENVNFVEGFKGNVVDRKNVHVSFLDKDRGVEEVEVVMEAAEDKDEEFKKRWEVALEQAKANRGSVVSVEKSNGEWSSVVSEAAVSEMGGSDASGREIGGKKSGGSGNKKKIDDQTMQLWRDLVRNPLQWWDFRGHKANGLVKDRYPDFKQKVSNEPLWVDSAPDWVVAGLGKLELDVPNFTGVGGTKSGGKSDESWKNLLEDFGKWWDNRAKKKNSKQPDFKRKETGEVLWLSSAPDWVVSGLEKLEIGDEDIKPKPVQASQGLSYGAKSSQGMKSGGKSDESWKNFVETPSKWWDNRASKKNPKQPDFKHKETGEALWLSSVPAWALSKIPPLKDGQTAL